MKKVIRIDNKEVGFKATALTLRLYRHFFGRDMISDMVKLKKAYAKASELPEDATEEEKREARKAGKRQGEKKEAAYMAGSKQEEDGHEEK